MINTPSFFTAVAIGYQTSALALIGQSSRKLCPHLWHRVNNYLHYRKFQVETWLELRNGLDDACDRVGRPADSLHLDRRSHHRIPRDFEKASPRGAARSGESALTPL